MSTITCLAGMLVINTVAYNPEHVVRVDLLSESIRMYTSDYRFNTHDLDSEEKANEAWTFIVESLVTCQNDFRRKND